MMKTGDAPVSPPPSPSLPSPLTVGLLVFPGLTALDALGPYEVFARAPNTRVLLISSSSSSSSSTLQASPILSDSGISLLPHIHSLSLCPPLDVLLIPGGPGQVALMENPDVLAWIERQSRSSCRYITSVCTGALVLASVGGGMGGGGGSGLLLQRKGVRATTHWMFMEQLRAMGVEAVEGQRVVRAVTTVPCWDEKEEGEEVENKRGGEKRGGEMKGGRNEKEVVLYTGGGVTAGIDFAFAVVRDVWGEDEAQAIQLKMEYFPALPLGLLTSRPEVVRKRRGKEAKVLERVEMEGKELKERREKVCARVKTRLQGKK